MTIGDLLKKEIVDNGAKKAMSMSCPSCSGPMEFREERGGYFYCCSKFPECNVIHAAHANSGKPMGKPADAKTRYHRIRAHEAFDAIWKSYKGAIPRPMVRRLAYDWLAKKLDVAEAHIGGMNEWACEKVVEACRGVTIEGLLKERQKPSGVAAMSPEDKRLFVMGIERADRRPTNFKASVVRPAKVAK
jgi:ssDNA-binding Zn-finger/Zn-ribbon topoisomerase 1